jgi:hypothetical protein
MSASVEAKEALARVEIREHGMTMTMGKNCQWRRAWIGRRTRNSLGCAIRREDKGSNGGWRRSGRRRLTRKFIGTSRKQGEGENSGVDDCFGSQFAAFMVFFLCQAIYGFAFTNE